MDSLTPNTIIYEQTKSNAGNNSKHCNVSVLQKNRNKYYT